METFCNVSSYMSKLFQIFQFDEMEGTVIPLENSLINKKNEKEMRSIKLNFVFFYSEVSNISRFYQTHNDEKIRNKFPFFLFNCTHFTFFSDIIDRNCEMENEIKGKCGKATISA